MSLSSRKINSPKHCNTLNYTRIADLISQNYMFIVFLLALGLNTGILIDYQSSPFSKYPVWDAANYWNWALEIASGNWLGSKVFHQSPLYPYLLSFFITVFGDNLFPIYCFQCLLSALTAMMLSMIGHKVCNNWLAGMLAGLIYTFYGMQVFYATKILTENIAMFLAVLTVWLIMSAKNSRMILSAGLSYGLLLITKSYFLIVLPFIVVFYYIAHKNDQKVLIKRVLSFLCPCVFVLFVIAARNYYVAGEFILVTSNFGENIYIGNHENATGAYIPIKGVSSNILYQDADIVSLARYRSGKQMTRSEVSQYWLHNGIEFIKNNPAKYLILEWKKFLNIASGIDLTNMYILDFEKRHFTHLFKMPFIDYYVLFPLFLIGIGTALYFWRTYLVVLAFLCTNILMMLVFFYDSRFLVVSMPFFIVISAVGLWKLVCISICGGGFKKLLRNPVMIVLFCSLLLDLAFHKRSSSMLHYDAQKWMTVGEIYYSRGELDKSIDAFVNASNADKYDFWPSVGISKVIFKKGQKEIAGDLFKKSYLAMNPDQKLSIIREREYDQIREYLVSQGIMDSTSFQIKPYE